VGARPGPPNIAGPPIIPFAPANTETGHASGRAAFGADRMHDEARDNQRSMTGPAVTFESQTATTPARPCRIETKPSPSSGQTPPPLCPTRPFRGPMPPCHDQDNIAPCPGARFEPPFEAYRQTHPKALFNQAHRFPPLPIAEITQPRH